MNQQRSRRFRSAQEAKEKEEQRLEGIALFEGESHYWLPRTVSQYMKSYGKSRGRGSQEHKNVGLQRYHPRYSFHGVVSQVTAILGCEEAQQ